ncbi:MAG: 16S rRNA (cytosine(967)-C(5))-methyltransferase RsmB [Candidatus Latescibacteria bacterium]|nr:16S rRNA (cytosine(967)-C(5))-methyltransferase RsmB [Candidatus Latescibacterota bacterium]
MKSSDPARALALRLLCNFESTGAPLDQCFEGLDQGLREPRDRRFARHLVLGVTRWQAQLDYILDTFTRRPLASCDPVTRQILRLGAFQLLHLDKVPERAAVHTSVELAKGHAQRGVPELVNAVLRRVAATAGAPPMPDRGADLAGHLAVCHSHPRWLVERWLARWGADDAEALLQADNQQPPLYVRQTRAGTEPPPAARPAGPVPGFFALDDSEAFFQSPGFRGGDYQVQDINAGLPVCLLQPQPGERVLDACSAPGGKTTQMAAQMQDRGLVVAADLSARRLVRLRENQTRLGLCSLRLVVEDARSGQSGPYDRVLVDAPCSATGTLARHPDVRWRKQPDQLPGLSATQHAMLCHSFDRLRPGGVLVYSTCSLEAEENTQVVERFLGATPAARLEAAAGFFPGQPWAGAYVQTLPGREPGDGCFAARIRRGAP